ncbi:unnamed protein product [Closterium sp. Naga37s-1]|nr:unnamed protein product [Closterium sp. Naga37s-1]
MKRKVQRSSPYSARGNNSSRKLAEFQPREETAFCQERFQQSYVVTDITRTSLERRRPQQQFLLAVSTAPISTLTQPTACGEEEGGKACARGGEGQERRGEEGGAAMDDMQGRVEARLRAALQPQELVVIDTSAGHCGTAFDVAVVSPLFEGKRLLERHRMVNSALSDEMPHIHALSIKKAWTPEQMQAQQNK